MSDNRPYDLLLRGGHVICPASDINGVTDVAIRDGQIAEWQVYADNEPIRQQMRAV